MRELLAFAVFIGIAAVGDAAATEARERGADRATPSPPTRAQDPGSASPVNGGSLQCDIRRPSCRKWQALANDRIGVSKDDN